ncbi:ABC transporter ATP-binding protein [Candidatus Bipolaricaulota bacterium]|nr:ABC transporter ATP-binding protein [Candidatus Bipolaricaulota bacterium]
MSLIDLKDLKTYFYTEDGVVQAVDGVTFSINRQQTMGVVGESGSGKSVTALSVMGLVPMPPGKIVEGEILFHRDGGTVDLTKLNPKGKEMRSIRGNEIAMIFQEPMTSLNPVFTIGNQIMEAITLHQNVNKKKARKIAINMLEEVGIPLPEQRVDEYPHQLSGGMRQRAMIAMALSCNPTMLIADEPTTALDVTIQAQILELMADLQEEFDTSIMFITHDLGVIAEITNFVVVMYLGKIVESGEVHEIYHNPTMPYTQGLMESIPSLDVDKGRLQPIKGVVPDPYDVPEGCPFNNRCPHVMDVCKEEDPPLVEVAQGHKSACWLHIDH